MTTDSSLSQQALWSSSEDRLGDSLTAGPNMVREDLHGRRFGAPEYGIGPDGEMIAGGFNRASKGFIRKKVL